MTIGARQSGAATDYDLQFNGIVDEVAIYNVALSAGQVLNHYYAGQFPPVVTVQPTNTTVAENSTATLYSSAYGPTPLAYQWYLSNGTDPTSAVGGQTSSNLVINNASVALSGNNYQLVVTNTYGAVTSAVAQLTIIGGPPSILVDLPSSILRYAGGSASLSLSVQVVGTAPFTYQWQKNGGNLADSARISGSQSNVLTIAILLASDSGNYQLLVSNGQGPASSTLSAVTVIARPSFLTNGVAWTLNGTPTPATVTDNALTLTTGAGGNTKSAFFNFPLYVGAFQAAFTYQEAPGAGAADGMAFVLHNDPRGTAALGGGGGSLGYSGITPSAALLFNIYAPNTVGIAFRVNGAIPAAGTYTVTTPLNVASGNPIDVGVRYTPGRVQVTLIDRVTAASFTTNITINLPAILGGNTAYVGFTGTDGGVVSTQVISNFTYVPLPALAAQFSSPDTLLISWPATIGGFVLQSRPDVAGGTWQDDAAPVSGVGGNNQATITPLTGNKFYRLNLP